jgi:microcystin-dependent protein
MWSGTAPPEGWKLCNGQTFNGQKTPNLQGRFIVGYHPDRTDYSDIGKIGGEETHTLTINEMPSHNHGMFDKSNGGGGDWRVLSSGAQGENYDESYDLETLYAGGSLPHENRPPYYVLAFIMRVQ